MCGIALQFGKNVNESNLSNMLNLLDHRGPDSKNILKIQNNLIFGHTRLNIIDLSNRSNQPMYNKRCYLIFNGIIYNYLELKKILQKNYNFKTNSDTEVVLAAYLSWGKNFFKKLDGMFSIVIWDDNKKKLIIARDRLGIKPLYYRIHESTLYVSSEIKPLLSISENEINKKIIYNYFKYSLYENRENIFFKNIKQFEPGKIYLLSEDLKIKKETYWNLFEIVKKSKENKIIDVHQAYDLLKVEIDRIIEFYTRSDTKISLLYSSGLDSNALLHLMNKKKTNIDLLLSFGFEAKGIVDEIKLMKETQYNHFKRRFKLSELINNLDNIQFQQEMPWGGPNVYFMSEILDYSKKKNYKVCLSADGADEIFGGYDKYYLNGSAERKIDLNYVSLAIDKSKPHEVDLFENSFNRNISEQVNLKLPSDNYMDNARYIDITLSKLPRNFRFSDRYSMYQSIELRYPFLDHKLIELSFRFSEKLLITHNKNKVLLRKLYDDNKPKKNINGPQTAWLYEKKFIAYIDNLVKSSPIFDFGIDKDKCKSFINKFYKTKQNNSFKMWQLINYHIWLKMFF
jgi:asparagine synthase (glutamine-hydrolysing)